MKYTPVPSLVGVWDEPLSAHTVAGSAGEILSNADTSVIPAQVWGYSNSTTSAGTMGQSQVDTEANTDLTQAKVDTL